MYFDPMKPHCLACPYKPPLEREKVERQLFVQEDIQGKHYLVSWLGDKRGVREVSKKEFDEALADMMG